MGFTFLNTTGAPGPSPSTTKQMRAHVTKTNFANRRRRIAEAKKLEQEPERVVRGQRRGQQPPAGSVCTVACSPDDLSTPADPLRPTQLLSAFWSRISLDADHYPSTPDEAAWLDLLASEPALIESTLAVTTQHWLSDILCKQRAGAHLSRAANILVQRIKSRRALTDAVLMAVLTMAFGERLANNDIAWGIHIDGIADLLRERYSQGICAVPPWVTGLVVSDSVNDLFNFPRVYHSKIVDALESYGDVSVARVAVLSDGIVRLWGSINAHRTGQRGPSFVVDAIEAPLARLHTQARDLGSSGDPFVKATSFAIELVLELSWPTQPSSTFTILAGKLKDAIFQIPVRPCFFMDLTSIQLMIGAIAAEEGSQTRAWFLGKLKRAILELRSRGWDEPLELLDRVYVPNIGLMGRFKGLWDELSSSAQASCEQEVLP